MKGKDEEGKEEELMEEGKDEEGKAKDRKKTQEWRTSVEVMRNYKKALVRLKT